MRIRCSIQSIPALLLLSAVVSASVAFGADAPKPSAVTAKSFDVIGISVRTNNTAEMGGDGEIPKLWQRLFMEGILGAIPDRLDDGIVAVYTKYASDASGDYTYILGAKVKPGTKAPEGMVSVTVPAGKYEEFVTDKGPGAEVVPAAWKSIYAYFGAPGAPARAFNSDYEIYADLSNPGEMQGNIFVGLKP